MELTIKQITESLKKGEIMTKGKKQLSYCEHSFSYVVNGKKTISIHKAMEEFNK